MWLAFSRHFQPERGPLRTRNRHLNIHFIFIICYVILLSDEVHNVLHAQYLHFPSWFSCCGMRWFYNIEVSEGVEQSNICFFEYERIHISLVSLPLDMIVVIVSTNFLEMVKIVSFCLSLPTNKVSADENVMKIFCFAINCSWQNIKWRLRA